MKSRLLVTLGISAALLGGMTLMASAEGPVVRGGISLSVHVPIGGGHAAQPVKHEDHHYRHAHHRHHRGYTGRGGQQRAARSGQRGEHR